MLIAQKISQLYKSSTTQLKIMPPHKLDKYDAGTSGPKEDKSPKDFRDILQKEFAKKGKP